MTYKKAPFIILVFTAILMFGCEGSNTENDTVLDVKVSDDYNSESEIESEPLKYKGFIGTHAVTAELNFDYNEGTILGSYYYDKYEKSIPLTGYIDSPEGTWTNYMVFEIDEKNDTTAFWDLNDTAIDYEINGLWLNPKTKKQFNFRLTTELMGGYVEPNSHIHFESEKKSTTFFKTHHFLHNETIYKHGLIIAEDYSKQYEEPLPIGLPIYEYGVNEGYGIGLMGEIVDGGLIKKNGEQPVRLKDEYDLVMITSVGYEETAYGFSEIIDDSLILLLAKNGNDICIKISDLEKYNYHLEGDGYWFKSHSHNVMGYFPAYLDTEVEYEYYHPTVIIYEENNIDSKELLAVEYEKQSGYFSVDDVKYVNGRYWAEVEFDYYTEEPCSGETFEDQPTVNGWILFYSSEALLKEVVLGYYSKGC